MLVSALEVIERWSSSGSIKLCYQRWPLVHLNLPLNNSVIPILVGRVKTLYSELKYHNWFTVFFIFCRSNSRATRSTEITVRQLFGKRSSVSRTSDCEMMIRTDSYIANIQYMTEFNHARAFVWNHLLFSVSSRFDLRIEFISWWFRHIYGHLER